MYRFFTYQSRYEMMLKSISFLLTKHTIQIHKMQRSMLMHTVSVSAFVIELVHSWIVQINTCWLNTALKCHKVGVNLGMSQSHFLPSFINIKLFCIEYLLILSPHLKLWQCIKKHTSKLSL